MAIQSAYLDGFMAFTITAICLLLLSATAASAFSMKLIPRHSLHPNNLTESQLIQLLIQDSMAYARSFDAGPTMLRPVMTEKRMLYLVQTFIGTGAGANLYTLHFDLGSDLTWIQCLPCDPCFRQPSPTFNPEMSTTFSYLSHDHRLCLPPYGEVPDNGLCTYDIDFFDNTAASGVLAQERFTFVSDTGSEIYAVFQGLAFGCTRASNFPDSDSGDWDGILGMGLRKVSIVSQLDEIIKHRFSYCLVKPESGLSSFLRFGPEPTREYQTTPIYTYEDSDSYYLNLEGISVDGRRLDLPPDTFKREDLHEGGFVVDTGTSLTHLIGLAYAEVGNALFDYLESLHLERADSWSGLTMCYKTPPSPETLLPSMVFHFENADYVLPWDSVFWFIRDQGFFCWAMMEINTISLFGARQMANYRFAFNLEDKVLSFASETCADDVPHA